MPDPGPSQILAVKPSEVLPCAGVTAGQLQQLQLCLAEWAGMAANMCASLGWWQLETLLAALAQQAAAGACVELLNLMQVRQGTLGQPPQHLRANDCPHCKTHSAAGWMRPEDPSVFPIDDK